jgi:hypothetical protein
MSMRPAAFRPGRRRQPMAEICAALDCLGKSRPYAELHFGRDNGFAAVPAHDLWLHVVAACLVVEPHRSALTLVEPLVTPCQHRGDYREQIVAHFGQQVLIPRRVVLIELLGEHARVHQAGKSIGQRIAGDLEGLLELVEPRHPVHAVTQDHQRPRVAEDSDSARDRARPAQQFPLHVVKISNSVAIEHSLVGFYSQLSLVVRR